MSSSSAGLTELLNNLGSGDSFALNEILQVVYKELKSISSRYLNEEYRKNTMQTTELVHEAYIKLIGNSDITWQSRAHFFGIAAKTMRQILVDHARHKKALKRGDGLRNITLGDTSFVINDSDRILALDDALQRLEQVEERSCKIVELRYFSGLSIEETAETLNISPATVKRDWSFAKAWLYRELQ
jgi:RNA polymerase sigma factor (TIGR02999 family)